MQCCGKDREKEGAEHHFDNFKPIITEKRITFKDGDGDVIDFKVVEGELVVRGQKQLTPLHIEMSVNSKKLCNGQAVEYLEWDKDRRRLKDPEGTSAPIPKDFDEQLIRALTERWNASMETFVAVYDEKQVKFVDQDGDVIHIRLVEEALDNRNQNILSPIQFTMTVNSKPILNGDAVEYFEWDASSRRLRCPERTSSPVPLTVDIDQIRGLCKRWEQLLLKPCQWRLGKVKGAPVLGSTRSKQGAPPVRLDCGDSWLIWVDALAEFLLLQEEITSPKHKLIFKEQLRHSGNLKALTLFGKLDKDQNHVVDKAEFVAAGGTEEQFTEFDTDGDGLIDAKELTNAVEKGGWAIAGEQL